MAMGIQQYFCYNNIMNNLISIVSLVIPYLPHIFQLIIIITGIALILREHSHTNYNIFYKKIHWHHYNHQSLHLLGKFFQQIHPHWDPQYFIDMHIKKYNYLRYKLSKNPPKQEEIGEQLLLYKEQFAKEQAYPMETIDRVINELFLVKKYADIIAQENKKSWKIQWMFQLSMGFLMIFFYYQMQLIKTNEFSLFNFFNQLMFLIWPLVSLSKMIG
jgi:hypothetical protein